MSKADKQNKTQSDLDFLENVQLTQVELVNCHLNQPPGHITEELNLNYSVALEHRFELDKELVLVAVEVSVSDGTSKDVVFGTVTVGCVFHVNQLQQFYEVEHSKVLLPESFIIAMNAVSISTSRGVVFMFFKGTYLNGATLPIINPNAFKKIEQVKR